MNFAENPLCSKWSTFLTLGIVLIILGTIALGSAFWTTMATVWLFGIVLAAGGIAQVIHSFYNPEWKGFFGYLFLGILSTVVGWLIITNPIAGATSLTLILAALFIASGLFRIATSLFGSVEHWGWLLFNGIITLILGVLILAQWPLASLWVIGLFIAIDLLITGWTHVIMSFALRKRCSLEKTEPIESHHVV